MSDKDWFDLIAIVLLVTTVLTIKYALDNIKDEED